MEVVQLIKNLEKYSREYIEDNSRELLDINKFVKDGYSYGFVLNKINTIYEVYMFVVSDTDNTIVTNLFNCNFKDKEEAKAYFNDLVGKYNEMNLEELNEYFITGTNE